MDHVKATVRRQFGRQADAYDASRSHAEGADLDILLDLLAPADDERALDVATGPGFVAARLAARTTLTVGLDLTGEMLARAALRMQQQRVRNVRLVQGDAEALPFADGAFDIVTCRRSAHHFPRVLAAVDEMARVLRSGGRLGIIDQVSPEDERGYALMEALEVARDPGHVRALRATEWGAVVEEAGLRLRHLSLDEEQLPLDEWMRMAGTDEGGRARVAALLAAAPPEALRSIGYGEGGAPAYTKRRVIVVAERP